MAQSADRFLYASPCLPTSSSESRLDQDLTSYAQTPVLTPEQTACWQTQGYTLVSGLFPRDLIDEVANYAKQQFPAPDSEAAAQIADFGSGGALNFPAQNVPFNNLTLHPRLLTAAAQLLDTQITDLRLSQADLWAKYGRQQKSAGSMDNMDQRIHVDYPNHTLAHPTPWARPEAVELIVYFADYADAEGATAVVPRQGPNDPAYRWPIVDTPGIADLDYVNDRASAERYFAEQRPELAQWRRSLYEREHYAHYQAGDVLFYRHDTWHRGTPMIPDTLRLVQNITYRRAAAEWFSTLHVGWAWSAYRKNKFLERLIATSSLEQRAVLGFPQPGNPYWCEETLQAVAARYGVFGFDIAPYL